MEASFVQVTMALHDKPTFQVRPELIAGHMDRSELSGAIEWRPPIDQPAQRL